MQAIILSLKSIYNRRFTAFLTIASIALSVALLLGVQRVRRAAEESFSNTISKVDLLVGARTGPVQLLLYSVFRIGNATNNISWESYEAFASSPDVKWTVPISLGDSHRGFRVVGTSRDYFTYYRYAQDRELELVDGKIFKDVFGTVLGAEVADQLGYQVGDEIVISHGIGETSFQDHADKPFVVAGVLKRTGTPVDRSVHVSLAGMEAIHVDWKGGAPPRPGEAISPERVREMDLKPHQITAFMVGLKSRIGIFRLQRAINEYEEEPLLAIIPGVTFQQLWQTVGVVETALVVVSIFVVLAGLLGMLTSILTTLNERRREMAILRSVGAKPYHVFFLLVSEAGFLATLGAVVGGGLLYLLLIVGQPIIEAQFGLFMRPTAPTCVDGCIFFGVILAGVLTGCIPAWQAYRRSLADGLTIRL